MQPVENSQTDAYREGRSGLTIRDTLSAHARNLVLLGSLAIIVIFFAIMVPHGTFVTERNLVTICLQIIIVALASLGMTMVIISGGIDLSVGSVIALSTVTLAYFLKNYAQNFGHHPLLISGIAAAIGIATGMVCGFGNGLLITRLRLVPFIATLGMMGIARGVGKWVAGQQKIDAPAFLLDKLMSKSPDERILLFPPGTLIVLAAFVLVVILLHRTIYGKYVLAIGSNEPTARLCGINVDRYKIYVYTLSGFFIGLAGLAQFSRLTVGDPTVAIGIELDVIAAVVIGGGSLSGGEGSVLGSVIGAFIMAVLRSGCSMMGWPNYIQEILLGVIIIAAVAFDQLRVRRAS